MIQEEKKSIFRKKALEKVSSLEELDIILNIVKPKDWIALIVGIIIGISIILWAFFGKIISIAGGNGIFLDFSKIVSVVSPTDGIVDVKEFIGSRIKKDDVIAIILDQKVNKKISVKSPYDGLITNIYQNNGDIVSKDQTLMELQRSKNISKSDSEKFYCFVPVKQGDKIRNNMKVKIFSWALEPNEKKYFYGIVEKISYIPADETYFNTILLGKRFYNYFTNNGPVVPVIVRPLYIESKVEPPLADDIPLGTLSDIDVILIETKPIVYLLPFWFSKKIKL
jgi:HlyD family secretion protein